MNLSPKRVVLYPEQLNERQLPIRLFPYYTMRPQLNVVGVAECGAGNPLLVRDSETCGQRTPYAPYHIPLLLIPRIAQNRPLHSLCASHSVQIRNRDRWRCSHFRPALDELPLGPTRWHLRLPPLQSYYLRRAGHDRDRNVVHVRHVLRLAD